MVVRYRELPTDPWTLLNPGPRGKSAYEIAVENGFVGTEQEWLDSLSPEISGTVESVNGRQGSVVLTKTDVGLVNVDNTSDAAKPVSTATQNALNLKAPLASPAFTGTPTGITKAHVGLANVDNTSDVNKPISTATQAALNAKANTSSLAAVATSGAYTDLTGQVPTAALPSLAITDTTPVASQAAMLALPAQKGDIAVRTDTSSTYILAAEPATVLANWVQLASPNSVTSVAGRTGAVVLAKGDVGLANVDNTSDVNKPVSTATQTALNLKAPLASPTFTGTVSGITKAMVGLSAVPNVDATNRANHTGTQLASTISDLDTRLDSVAPRSVRPMLPVGLKLITDFGPGHGFSSSGSGTVDIADDVDDVLGSTAVAMTTATDGSMCKAANYGVGNVDLTGMQLYVLIKVSDVTKLDSVQLYVGGGGFSWYRLYNVAFGGATANGSSSTLRSNEWTWVAVGANGADDNGTINLAASNNMQLAVTGVNGQAVTVKWGAIGYYPPASAYPHGVVSFTFDDAFASAYTWARPALADVGAAGSAMIIVDSIGQPFGMTQTQVDLLHDVAGWDISGHAMTLANHNAGLDSLNPTQLKAEVAGMRSWLSTRGYRGQDIFAYPQGKSGSGVAGVVGDYFSLARGTYGSPPSPLAIGDPLNQRTLYLHTSTTLADAKSKVDDAYDNQEWLIILAHNIVGSSPTVDDWTVADLEALITYCRTKGIAIDTVSTVMTRLKERQDPAVPEPFGSSVLVIESGGTVPVDTPPGTVIIEKE